MKKIQTKEWYLAKVKHVKTNDVGKEVKVSEGYLVDAVTYEDAETRMYLELESMGITRFTLSLNKSNIVEVIPSDDENDDRWYKAKVSIIDADELTGKEKRVSQYHLIAAKDINTALLFTDKSFSTYIVPYEICSINDTNIVDVFEYTEIHPAFNPMISYEPKSKVSYKGGIVQLTDGGVYSLEDIEALVLDK